MIRKKDRRKECSIEGCTNHVFKDNLYCNIHYRTKKKNNYVFKEIEGENSSDLTIRYRKANPRSYRPYYRCSVKNCMKRTLKDSDYCAIHTRESILNKK